MHQCDDPSDLQPVRSDIPPEIRLYVIQLLLQTLACTVALRSQVKQARWNVMGDTVVPLQALFATMATDLDAYTDLVAERLVVLGGTRGTARTAARQSTLLEYPGAILEGRGRGGAGGRRGALIGMGIPEYEAKRYEGKIKEGNMLISVHTEDSTERDRAKTIFEQAGAEDISYTEEARVQARAPTAGEGARGPEPGDHVRAPPAILPASSCVLPHAINSDAMEDCYA